jgi:hypothetical protein
LNKKTLALKLLKNPRTRRLIFRLLKNPRVQRAILKQIERRIRRR